MNPLFVGANVGIPKAEAFVLLSLYNIKAWNWCWVHSNIEPPLRHPPHPHLPNMGNTASVEELGRGRRTSHKLAKPRVGNHETNTLLSPIGLPDPRRRFSATRATSLSYGTSPAPSPMWPPADYTMDQPVQVQEDLLQVKTRSRSRSITRSAVNLFRSRSSQPSHGARRRQDSLGMQTPSQSARPSRANSMIVGASESHFVQSNVTA